MIPFCGYADMPRTSNRRILLYSKSTQGKCKGLIFDRLSHLYCCADFSIPGKRGCAIFSVFGKEFPNLFALLFIRVNYVEVETIFSWRLKIQVIRKSKL
ncbi:hypothetical protein GQ457_12G029630 [Hibiscus cannabinus]